MPIEKTAGKRYNESLTVIIGDQQDRRKGADRTLSLKDIRRIRKRIDPALENFRSVYGCYVNGAGEIVSTMEIPVLDMENEEREMYAAILKKVLSGAPDRNLIPIGFPVDKVGTSDEHRLLMALRDTQARDGAMRDMLYRRVIGSLVTEGESYVILLAADTYDIRTEDVPDQEWSEESTEQFSYVLCAICPVKTSRAALQYQPGEQEFRGISTGSLLAPPFLGFMFPVLEDGAADIYQALYYTKSAAENHGELIRSLFLTENPPMAAEEQRDTFNATLSDALGNECSIGVVSLLQSRLAAEAETAREDKLPPVTTLEEIGEILTGHGISEQSVRAFSDKVRFRFDGEDTFNINNLIRQKTFEVQTPDTRVTTDPELALDVQIREIDGRMYLLVPIGDSVTVNGVGVTVLQGGQDKES